MKNNTVSIVLATKNSREMLEKAMQSLVEQTYKDFEVVVIDGVSTDGSLDYLSGLTLNIRVISEPDKGISDAYSKALANAQGDIVGILSTDERYYPDTIETVVNWFKENPEHIVCGGKLNFLNNDEKVVDSYLDDYLDLYRHLSCEHICSISASFFNRKLLADQFHYKADFATCCDYELWARLALSYPREKFVWQDQPITKAIRAEVSMSFRDDSFNQMVTDKINYLQLFWDNNRQQLDAKAIDYNQCVAGIHMWACEQLNYINYRAEEIYLQCKEAFHLAPDYPRVRTFIDKHPLLTIQNGKIIRLIDEPTPSNVTIVKDVTDLLEPQHGGERLGNNQLITDSNPWGYSFSLNLAKAEIVPGDENLWIHIALKVNKGSIGIGKLMDNYDIKEEKIVRKSTNAQDIYIQLTNSLALPTLILRSGGEALSEIFLERIAVISNKNAENLI